MEIQASKFCNFFEVDKLEGCKDLESFEMYGLSPEQHAVTSCAI